MFCSTIILAHVECNLFKICLKLKGITGLVSEGPKRIDEILRCIV